jgi:hypothetical protein
VEDALLADLVLLREFEDCFERGMFEILSGIKTDTRLTTKIFAAAKPHMDLRKKQTSLESNSTGGNSGGALARIKIKNHQSVTLFTRQNANSAAAR